MWPPYRTMDEGGSPTAAGVVGWNWISELAQAEREEDAALLVIQSTPVNGGGNVVRLYRSTTLLAVATTFRDDMNFTVLVRWQSPCAATRDSDGTASAALCEDIAVPQDCQARAEGIAQPLPSSDKERE